jgi:hypothetical protein
MAPPSSFLDLTASDLLDELAGPVPPGGGSALAFTVAMAAAVVRMAARASKDTWDAAGGIAAQADALRARAAPLAQHDAEVYEQALAGEARLGDRQGLRGRASRRSRPSRTGHRPHTRAARRRRRGAPQS